MILSMGGFAIEDLILKILSDVIPISQILVYVGVLGAILLTFVSKMKQIPIIQAGLFNNKLFLIRTLSDMLGAVLFIIAISLMPLSTVSSILQTTPLFVTLGAFLLFKESVGWRRWGAVFIGFFGILLILKPDAGSLDAKSFIALLAVAFIALRDIVTRRLKSNINSITVSLYAFILTAVGGILCVPFFENFVILTFNQWFVVLISTLIGCASYLLLVLATRQGDVSVISPFRYTRLIFALILAILFLGERPDILALSGMAIIVLSGCYTLWREKVRGQSSSV